MHCLNACQSVRAESHNRIYPPGALRHVPDIALGRCPCNESDCMLSEVLTASASHRKHSLIQEKTYRPKEVLFRQGMPATHLLILRSGYAKLSMGLPDGQVQGLRISLPGQALGIEALSDQRYLYTVEALTEITVCRIGYNDMVRLLEQNPTVSLKVITGLNQTLRDTWETICSLRTRTATGRVADFLLMLTPATTTPGQKLPLPLSRTAIAEMLGITLETVCRILSRLIRDKIIEAPPSGGYFRVLDRSRLAALAGKKAAASRLSVNG